MAKPVPPSQGALFDRSLRLQMNESIDLTVESLTTHGADHDHWIVAYSGGKDSTALVTLVVFLIRTGRVKPPKRITVLYVDTRLELPPLAFAAARIRAELEAQAEELAALGCELTVRVVLPPMDHRYFVYIFGRGVPSPSNAFRWCTEKTKVDPIEEEIRRLAVGTTTKPLTLTGLRIGESAARDDRIVLSCGKDGGECGQGWYQKALPDALCAKLAPILWWRVCHVWAWLRHHEAEHGFDTALLAEAYGGDENNEANARTGCTGCPVAAEDHALLRICRMPQWAYLAPLQRLRPYYWNVLHSPASRLRQPPAERRKDGRLVLKQNRLGPLTFEARRAGLAFVLSVQAEVNEAARRLGRPEIDILNAEEVARIEGLIEAKTWPEKWDGDEPLGTEPYERTFADGTAQPLLPWLKDS